MGGTLATDLGLPVPETPPNTSESEEWGGLPTVLFPGPDSLSLSPFQDWRIEINRADVPSNIAVGEDETKRLNPDLIEDVLLVLKYTVGS